MQKSWIFAFTDVLKIERGLTMCNKADQVDGGTREHRSGYVAARWKNEQLRQADTSVTPASSDSSSADLVTGVPIQDYDWWSLRVEDGSGGGETTMRKKYTQRQGGAVTESGPEPLFNRR